MYVLLQIRTSACRFQVCATRTLNATTHAAPISVVVYRALLETDTLAKVRSCVLHTHIHTHTHTHNVASTRHAAVVLVPPPGTGNHTCEKVFLNVF